jgi:hypothetical protein
LHTNRTVQLAFTAQAASDACVSPASWLFIRGVETIRVVLGGEWKLLVSGPGAKRWSYTFSSGEERFEFQTSLEERLGLQGWVLEGYGCERRTGRDRRVQRRTTRDRRYAGYEKRH